MLSYQDIPPLLDRLDKLRKESPEHITFTYQKMFTMPEGQLILIDLMDKFCEFRPTANDKEAGAQGVIIYIKNKLLGVVEAPEQTQGELNVDES